MSEENEKVCCSCRHCISIDDWECECQEDGHYIGYVECMTGWCKHWAKKKEVEERWTN